MLKDPWGYEALDFAPIEELWNRYPNKIFVSVTDKPFGDSYVLFICNSDEEVKAEKFLAEYRTLMELKGITAYGAGVSLGAELQAARMEEFQGGADL